MRKTKKFTPKLLVRFMEQGRSTGTLTDFIPWHRVSRSDPPSHGRSHLFNWRDRLRELLSDGEWKGVLLVVLLRDVVDSREQFKLSVESALHELQAYDVAAPGGMFDGTLAIARDLGIRHPIVQGDGEGAYWHFTTDNLIALQDRFGKKSLLAVSFKSESIEALPPRKIALLSIEHEYWLRRGVEWLLITPEEYNHLFASCLRCSSGWGVISDPLPTPTLTKASAIAQQFAGRSLTRALNAIMSHLEMDMESAQAAFWQAVWKGLLPLDLRRSWRPSDPLRFLSPADFDMLNPIFARRSAWKKR